MKKGTSPRTEYWGQPTIMEQVMGGPDLSSTIHKMDVRTLTVTLRDDVADKHAADLGMGEFREKRNRGNESGGGAGQGLVNVILEVGGGRSQLVYLKVGTLWLFGACYRGACQHITCVPADAHMVGWLAADMVCVKYETRVPNI
jgi:hypothetical protein